METPVIPAEKLDLKAVRGILAILSRLVPVVWGCAIVSEISGHSVISVTSISVAMALSFIGVWLSVREWSLLNNSLRINKK